MCCSVCQGQAGGERRQNGMDGAGGKSVNPAAGRWGGAAVDETVILLHPLLHLVGVSIETMREYQQNDSLADGQATRSSGRSG